MDAGPAVGGDAREFKPIHLAWHVDIGEENADAAVMFEKGQRFVCVAGLKNFKACVHERCRSRPANDRIVFDDQDSRTMGASDFHACQLSRRRSVSPVFYLVSRLDKKS